MAKRNRGKSLKKMKSRGRGNCPLCDRTGIKLLYSVVTENGMIDVCKFCRKK